MSEFHAAETDWTAPIIIVGPGRSGTNLLNGLLMEHPDVLALGETTFLVQTLWSAIKTNPRGKIARQLRQARGEETGMSPSASSVDGLVSEQVRNAVAANEVPLALVEQEMARRGALLGRFFFELMCIPCCRAPRWCFKEIWAGRDSFPYTWDLYNTIFPRALYIQSLRHPFDYLKSYLARQDTEAQTVENIHYILSEWVQMMHLNMALASTGRYFNYKLEDLAAAPEQVFEQICAFLQLRSHSACLTAMHRVYGGTDKREVAVDPCVLDGTPGVRALMDELGYA